MTPKGSHRTCAIANHQQADAVLTYRKYKDTEPCDATSKEVDNRNRIFKTMCKSKLHRRARLALKSDAVVSFLFLRHWEWANANMQDTLKVCDT